MVSLQAPGLLAQASRNGGTMSLKEIDRLIDNTEYQRALDELTAYMEAHPREFDRAQQRVDRILRARAQYNEKAEHLLKIMAQDMTNDMDKMEIISELEKSEVDPLDQKTEFEHKARRTVALGFYLAYYNKTMAAGINLVNQEKYAQAARVFHDGMRKKKSDTDKIYKDDEEIPVTHAEDITAPTEESLAHIDALLTESEALYAPCQGAYDRFMAALQRQDYAAAERAFPDVERAFARFAETRNKIAAEVGVLGGIDALVQKRNPRLLLSYVGFSNSFVAGDEDYPESGILGAMDSFYNRRVEAMKGSVYGIVHDALAEVKDTVSIDAAENTAALLASEGAQLTRAGQFPPLGEKAQSLYGNIVNPDGTNKGAPLHEYDDSMEFAARFAKGVAMSLENMQDFDNENLRRFSAGATEADFPSQQAYLEAALEVAVLYEKIFEHSSTQPYVYDEQRREDDWFGSPARHKKSHESGVPGVDDVQDFRDVISYYTALNDANMAVAQQNSKGLWAELAQLFSGRATDSYEGFLRRYDAAEQLFDGIAEDSGDSDVVIVKKYPGEARDQAQKLADDIVQMQATLAAWHKPLATGEKFMNQPEEYTEGMRALDAAIAGVDELAKRNLELAAKAGVQYRRALAAEAEAKSYYEQAEAALKREDFDAARRFLFQSSDKYRESLDIQESAALRAASDAQLAALGERITRAENEIIVREVRKLINSAQDDYYNGNFDSAEKSLVRAQGRWSVTNTEQNQEIEDLLEIVRMALSAKSGRVLVATDPLYSDMSQILAMANQFFAEGEKLMKKGKRDEALLALARATEKIRALQQIYPLNQEAGFLTLKVEQLTDPDSFQQNFGFRVQTALADTNMAKRLATLQDLYKLNPKFPGLEKQIYDLEVAAGIRPRPVDNSARKRSDTLYEQARALYRAAGGNQAQLRAALARLDEALAVYDRNNSAKRLKDTIQSQIGGNSIAVLTSADEQLYQQAVNYYTSNNFVMADKVMELLWENPAAQRSAKIIDLRKRIKVRL